MRAEMSDVTTGSHEEEDVTPPVTDNHRDACVSLCESEESRC